MIGNSIRPSDLPRLRESFSHFDTDSSTFFAYFWTEFSTPAAHFGFKFSTPHPSIQTIIGPCVRRDTGGTEHSQKVHGCEVMGAKWLRCRRALKPQ